jgi:predicted nuclease of predicted toxin-antitoxin system
MKIVIDMNLSPSWVAWLTTHGHDAVHWSEVGDARAKDEVIMKWALEQGRIVLTCDLDFGDILAATKARAPSVVLLRTQDSFPTRLHGLS